MAEVVGVALGVASLVFTAVESYHATAGFFSALKHHPRKLREALQTLRMQELCFRKANERLLSYIVDIAEAREMLRDPNHPTWHHKEIASEYLSLLGGDHHGFESAVNLIRDRLDVVRAEFQILEVPPNAPVAAMKKQLRFAFEQTKIEKTLHDLMEKTQSFVALTHLVTPQVQLPETSVGRITSSSLKQELRRFSTVKETAEDLYLALCSACTQHDNHKALLSLSPTCSAMNQTQFTLAFSQLSIQPLENSVNGKPFWLTIESSITGRVESIGDCTHSVSRLQTRLKRSATHIDDDASQHAPLKTPTSKCVRFQTEGHHTQADGRIVSVKTQSNDNDIVNLCKQGKICHQLTHFMSLPRPNITAVGFLELSRGSKHLIYLQSQLLKVSRIQHKSELVSLRDFLHKQSSDDSTQDLAINHKTSLARQLARAVLHFHTTAWLQDNWSSQGILVKNGMFEDSSSDAPEAYADTRIDRPKTGTIAPAALPTPLVVRNRLVFSLGILLLELAYQKPLAALTTEFDRLGTLPHDVPYRTADRLSKCVSAKLGAKYAEVVRKCVHCDFGQGFDLRQPRLQEAFYKNAVCELDKLASTLA